MAKYRKKPIVIEARQVRQLIWDAGNNWAALPDWVKAAYEKGAVIFLPNEIHIGTLEGMMTADINDWLIQGVKGEIYPCKPDIFKATYEYVPDEAPADDR